MKLSRFDYASPTTVADVVGLLSRHEGARLIAGGQSLIPMLAFRLTQPSLLVDLRRVPGLDAIAISGAGVRLGAKVRWHDIETNADLAAAHPLLASAVKHVAHHQIRTRGTVGGSLAHADPAAEFPCLTVLCEAAIDIVGARGTRTVPAAAFFTGALSTVLGADELITAVALPAWPAQRRWGFEEFSRRRGDFALAGVALFFDAQDGRAANAHVAAFGVADTPVRLERAEAALSGREITAAGIPDICKAAQADIAPRDDIHGSSAYRRALVDYLLAKALQHSFSWSR